MERLRAYAKNQGGWHNIDDTCEEAADEIERLRDLFKIENDQHRKHIRGLQSQHKDEVEILYSAIERLRKQNLKSVDEDFISYLDRKDGKGTLVEKLPDAVLLDSFVVCCDQIINSKVLKPEEHIVGLKSPNAGE